MLPAAHRMRRASEFTSVVRGGTRSASRRVVVHLALDDPATPARFGLVVGKAVGPSVVRHRVSRQLRHQLAARLDRFPSGARVVVRALPAAAGSTSADIGEDLDRALSRQAGS